MNFPTDQAERKDSKAILLLDIFRMARNINPPHSLMRFSIIFGKLGGMVLRNRRRLNSGRKIGRVGFCALEISYGLQPSICYSSTLDSFLSHRLRAPTLDAVQTQING